MNNLETNKTKVQGQLIQFKNLLNNNNLIKQKRECEIELEKVKDYLWNYEKSIQNLNKSNTIQDTSLDESLIKEHREFQLRFKSTLRGLIIEYKKKLEALEHSELLEGKSKNKTKSLSHKKVLKQANEVTRSLQRTSELLTNEIERSSNSAQALSESSHLMETTSKEYENIHGLVSTSKGLLSGLEIQAWIDRISLLIGFLIFLSTVYYVISKRIYLPTLFFPILNISSSITPTPLATIAKNSISINTPMSYPTDSSIIQNENLDKTTEKKPLASDYIPHKEKPSYNTNEDDEL